MRRRIESKVASPTLVIAILAIALVAGSCSPAEDASTTTAEMSASTTTTTAAATSTTTGPIALSIEVSTRRGEAATVALGSGDLHSLETAAAENLGVTLKVEGATLVATASTTSDLGDTPIAVSTVGCAGDTCDIDITIEATVTVEPYPTSIEAAEPLYNPTPERVVDTNVASVREVSDELLVIADDMFDPAEAADTLGASFIGGLAATNVWQFVTTADDRDRLAGDLAGYPGVVEVLPHYLIDMPDTATGEAYPADWDTLNKAKTWHFDMIDAPELWFTQRWAPDVRVGIVDGGVWPHHPDFTVADRHVFNEEAVGDVLFGKKDHGTHVAGLACSDDQGVGTIGMAWGCNIYAADMVHPDIDGYSAFMIHDAMIRVADMGADVVNISIGGPDLDDGDLCKTPDDEVLLFASQMSRLYSEAVTYATQLRVSQGRPDIVWVVSAGNDCVDINYQAPARMGKLFDNVVTVASVDDDGQLSDFSNWGQGVTVAAPGGAYNGDSDRFSGVWSAGTDCGNGPCVEDYEFKDGTSMAAPIVTGLVALMRQGAPDLSAASVVNCLTSGATPVTGYHGNHATLDLAGVGLVNAPSAYACATNPEPPTADEIADLIGCYGDCSVTGTIPFTHPTWGPSTLATYNTSCGAGETRAGVVVFDAPGTEVWRWTMSADEVCLEEFSPGISRDSDAWSVDSLGHLFLQYNPGRFNGVIVLRPTPDGFDTLDGLRSDGTWAGWYYAYPVDLEGDGQFEIRETVQICEPSCAGGLYYDEVLRWDGTDYSPDWDWRYTYPIGPEIGTTRSDKYEHLFGLPVDGEPHWSGCSPGTPDTLPDGVWYGSVVSWNYDGVEFDLECDLGWTFDEDCQCEFPNISNTNPATRFLRWSDDFNAYAWARDDAYNYIVGPWSSDQLVDGDAKLLTPVDDPSWPDAPHPPVRIYVNDGVVTELEAIYYS